MPRRAKNYWSSDITIRPGRYRWTRCAGALFPTDVWTRQVGESRSTPSARLCGTCRRFAMRTASAAALYQLNRRTDPAFNGCRLTLAPRQRHAAAATWKYSCVQLGRRLGDQVADQNNITPDRHLGDRNGARHREVVQSDQGLWIYPAAGRRQRRIRPHHRGRARWTE